jgi:hypothetical protein
MSDTQLWLMVFFILASLIISLNFRSGIFAEEAKKRRIINNLLLKKVIFINFSSKKTNADKNKVYWGLLRRAATVTFNQAFPPYQKNTNHQR